MCLGIPAQIVAITDPARSLALADVAGIRRAVNVLCVLEPDEDINALIGVWVLLHVGFAVARLDEEEARITLDMLTEAGVVEEELASMAAS